MDAGCCWHFFWPLHRPHRLLRAISWSAPATAIPLNGMPFDFHREEQGQLLVDSLKGRPPITWIAISRTPYSSRLRMPGSRIPIFSGFSTSASKAALTHLNPSRNVMQLCGGNMRKRATRRKLLDKLVYPRNPRWRLVEVSITQFRGIGAHYHALMEESGEDGKSYAARFDSRVQAEGWVLRMARQHFPVHIHKLKHTSREGPWFYRESDVA